jgi:hypothetical protein
MNCDNCANPFTDGEDAYQVERGRIEFSERTGEFLFMCGSRPCTTFITLCADCYDDTWIIGEPLPKNRHLQG